jgi:2-dehydro-3-deoxy-D-arabinonate dehydratase
MPLALWNVVVDGRPRPARGPADGAPEELLPGELDTLLAAPAGAIEEALAGPALGAVPADAAVRAPLAGQEVWASGVTYRRSRQARMEESTDADVYDRVYEAERPELFFKCTGERVRGPGQTVGVRADSAWDVPEPELAVVANAEGRIVAYTQGNDVSSRSIEGENPLYLPQAKVYRHSCALGPCLVPVSDDSALEGLEISVDILREGRSLFSGTIPVTEMKRRPGELVDWLFRAMDFPRGVVLLTGTGLVPGDEVTLREGDEVAVATTGLGELRNPVARVGVAEPRTEERA